MEGLVKSMVLSVCILRIVGLAAIVSTMGILASCASSTRQQVIAVGQSDTAAMKSASITSYRASNTPQVALDLIDKAVKSINRERYALASKALGQAQRLAPNEARIYLAWGDLFAQQGQIPQAVQMYKRALSLSEAGSQTGRQADNKLSAIAPATSNY